MYYNITANLVLGYGVFLLKQRPDDHLVARGRGQRALVAVVVPHGGRQQVPRIEPGHGRWL